MSTLGGPNVITNGLVLALDAANTKSYNGSNWKELLTNSTYNGNSYASATWANNVEQLTISTIIQKTGNDPGYAQHPISKWNTGTGNASFVLYHFGQTGGQGKLSFYYTRGTVWTGQFVTTLTVGQSAHLTFQWNSNIGGQVWLNGNKVDGRSGSGLLGINGSGVINIFTPTTSQYVVVNNCVIYSRELTDIEIQQNFNATRGRVGL